MKRTATAIAVTTLIAAATLVPGMASATEDGMRARDCVYDYKMMTDRECHVYRKKMLEAKSHEERLVLRSELLKVMETRAMGRGISRGDWRDLSVAPPSAGEAQQ